MVGDRGVKNEYGIMGAAIFGKLWFATASSE